jgi:hypothetical protein
MSASHPVRAVGIAWYSRQDYRRVLEIMDDAAEMPTTFDQWLNRAEAIERELKRAGHVAVRAIIEPEEFAAWCRAKGLNIDAKSRSQWSSEFVARVERSETREPQ